uniref:Uncharacterized protein n=1 Tax=Oryza glumipatula TaxID=40148 RepID=A0A0D9ZEA2_9ORYZ
MKFFAAPAGRAGLGAVVLVAALRCPLFSFFALLLAAAKNRLTAADALLPRRCLAPLAGRHVAGWGRT